MAEMKIAAYEGSENYIFISYAHKDSEKVFPIMEELVHRGYRIWYDEGIAPGSEWPEDIARHLNGCAMAIAFVTPNSMASVNCRREINFAMSKQKPFLSVVLEPTEMPLGMELQLSAQQSVLRYNYRSEEKFMEKICACPDLDCCKAEPVKPGVEAIPRTVPVYREAPAQPVRPAVEPAPVRAEEPAPRREPQPKTPVTKAGPSKKLLGILGSAAALVILAVILLLSSKPKEAPSGTPETAAPQVQSDKTQSGEYTVHIKVPETWSNPGLLAKGQDGEQAPDLSLKLGSDGWYAGKVPGWANTLSINGKNGTVKSDELSLSGKEVWIIVNEDGFCDVSYKGPFAEMVTVYARVPSDWVSPDCWAWHEEQDAFAKWPGEPMKKEDNGWFSIRVPSWTTGVIISQSEAIQTEDIIIEPGLDIWIVAQDGWWIAFYEEPTEAQIRKAFG